MLTSHVAQNARDSSVGCTWQNIFARFRTSVLCLPDSTSAYDKILKTRFGISCYKRQNFNVNNSVTIVDRPNIADMSKRVILRLKVRQTILQALY